MSLNKKQQELQDESNRIIKTAFIRDAKINPALQRTDKKDYLALMLIEKLKEESIFRDTMEGPGAGVPGYELAEMLNTKTVQIRNIIQYIRVFNNDFLPGEFIVANLSGYCITNNFELIQEFFNKTHSRYKNTSAQVIQMAKLFPKLLGGM